MRAVINEVHMSDNAFYDAKYDLHLDEYTIKRIAAENVYSFFVLIDEPTVKNTLLR